MDGEAAFGKGRAGNCLWKKQQVGVGKLHREWQERIG